MFSKSVHFEAAVWFVVTVVIFFAYTFPLNNTFGPDEGSHLFTTYYYNVHRRLPHPGLSLKELGCEQHQPPLFYIISASVMAVVNNFTDPSLAQADRTIFKLKWIRRFWIPVKALTIPILFYMGCMLFPARRCVARYATVLLATLPQYGFMAAVLNNDNLACLLTALLLLETTRILLDRVKNWSNCVALIIFIGAAAGYTKLTSFAFVLFPVCALLLKSPARWRHTSIALAGISAAMAPLWMVNIVYWGDPFALNLLYRTFSHLHTPRILGDLSLKFTTKSYFGFFGGDRPLIWLTHWHYTAFLAVIVAATSGWLFAALSTMASSRTATPMTQTPSPVPESNLRWIRYFFFAAFLLNLCLTVRFGLEMLGGDQGRYLHLSALPLFLLISEGLCRLGNLRPGRLIPILACALWIFTAASAYLNIYLPIF